MENTTENVARLKHAYEQWHATRGGSKAVWLELAADNVQVGSLAEGVPGLEFTGRVSSREEFGRYFEGLLNDWEMIHYTADHFIADGARVVMRGSTAWRHKRTGREINTPKADFVTFRDGKIVEFYEFYDTAALRDAVRT